MIEVKGLTKIFFNGKGIFDLNFEIKQGEILGFLGPNGSGKSTTIRHLMGYTKPMKGCAKIAGLDCWSQSYKVHKKVGYIPGEITFMDGISTGDFLDLMMGLRGLKDKTRRKDLIERFQLDVRTPIRRMSKGMKQKLAIITAFMHDPEVLILDEPSSGLDPLMQRVFVDLLIEEKKKGKTILVSSHIFSEVEDTADAVCIVKNGRIIKTEDIGKLKNVMLQKFFEITLEKEDDEKEILNSGLNIIEHRDKWVKVAVNEDISSTLKVICKYRINNIDIPKLDLEDMFMHYYNTKEDK
jgi:ABC-2 type transport system ATP-binding protein